uniref:Kinesin-like protein n=1 Tax=Chaetoceros debilis TaxID=122233 RepID=A0A7S3V5B6_9STRA|mmetsp:Transcript_10430/g.15804  ORF Transcript_10430/g.15804 Transcript_10430/m.15804 type:complete len:579 (+) Transcript_10430:221-1957(+)
MSSRTSPSRSRRVSTGAKDQTRLRIERMEAEREERRRQMKERKLERAEEEQRNIAAGNPGDVDFIGLVQKWRDEHSLDALDHESETEQPKICVAVRKRPISERERKRKDHDSVTCLHPVVWVHNAKLKVDGITKYLDHSSFCFDYSFDEDRTTEDVYTYCTMPLVQFCCSGTGGRATVFAYGQTGSGKTYTMNGIESMVSEDIFSLLSTNSEGPNLDNTMVLVSFFEIYGGRIQDLLNKRERLKVLEDGKGEVVVTGLREFEANDPQHLLDYIESAQKKRTTHATEANDTSSRSHAICQIMLREKESGKLRGKMSLVDLAGSERGSDTKSHNRQRRTESSEINTSLLALKECIRALGGSSKHVPYRASKLTLILKDCFTSSLARTAMIATVSPGGSSADHTINTLRYSDRIKEKKIPESKPRKNRPPAKREVVMRPKTNRREVDTVDDDLDILHQSLNDQSSGEDLYDSSEEKVIKDIAHLHRTVQTLFEEEESLLNLHMSVIQENAELLTEEGKLLQSVQSEAVADYDIDDYASRLGTILDRKSYLITCLKDKLVSFRGQLQKEEELSSKIVSLPGY